jgi:hypothetical protein
MRKGSESSHALPEVMKLSNEKQRQPEPVPESFNEEYSALLYPVASHRAASTGADIKATEQNQIIYRSINLSN